MSNLLQNSPIELDKFSIKDHSMWQKLFSKQVSNLHDKAFRPFLDNLERLELTEDHIPSLEVLNHKLLVISGWQTIPVSGLIEHELYFQLLASKKFPVAMIMRDNDEENLSKDPDIFHEIFGHCTMLLTPEYAHFMSEFSRFLLAVRKIDRPLFARLLWFTTETGLINTPEGLRIFGSSILSSYTESTYSLQSTEPTRKPFELVEMFREPYRADILQKTYFILEDPKQLYSLLDDTDKLYKVVNQARLLGEHTPRFPITNDKYSNIGHCFSTEKKSFASVSEV